ncbi:Trm112 family protein [Malonomonas rubra]|uniref:Trm112 family protein n=1 Tax=Malonomonas rubra TaxID=57040 RepID=UPI0026EABD3A|nr:Trm112 family protein [Malonomonas rubra]
MTLSKDLLDILACPQCKGPVNYLSVAQEIQCDVCRLAYPVRDDIPVMLIDEARSLAENSDPADKA